MSLTLRIKAEARRLGFDLVGVLPAGPSLTHDFYINWLSRGYAGEMGYLERHAELKADLRRLAPQALSAIVLAINYSRPPPAAPHQAPDPTQLTQSYKGRISRYAWGRDYHDILRDKLGRLALFIERDIEGEAGHPVRSWAYVDSAPVMEREFAARAGLGWVGKHGVLINWEQGSWLFLAELLLEMELDYDAPPEDKLGDMRESCGTCTACIDACPTDAIVAEKTVDSRRCISYHTIELKGPIPEQFRTRIGDWVFGCDICQDVCPWNSRAPASGDPSFGASAFGISAFGGLAGRATPDLLHLLSLDAPGFQAEFGGTALRRTKRRGLLRNAAIALGNRLAELRGGKEQLPDGHQPALAALQSCLDDGEPLIRGAAAWALGKAGARETRDALARAGREEQDEAVRGEIERAIAQLS